MNAHRPSRRASRGSVLVTGGAGYIGSILVPELVLDGWDVTVLDRFFFRRPEDVDPQGLVRPVELDIRDLDGVREVLERGRFDAVVHLAAISNDPTSELDPELTRSVNKTAVDDLMQAAKAAGVGRFLYASSASVYGIKSTPDVTEELSLEPITLYARYKAEGEDTLWGLCDREFCGVAVRAATVCGYSPRLRLDLTINILTEHALTRGAIRVFGGEQMRPNVHVRDLAGFYRLLLEAPAGDVAGKAFNVCRSNATVLELAQMIRGEIDPGLPIDIVPSDDLRSYHLSAGRAQRELGFEATTPLTLAVRELGEAFADGRVDDPSDPVYRNIETMKRSPELWRSAPRTSGSPT
ncbi:MAG: NAD-dependent epimerase/dehydratase family protein [Thermoanaerobaculia bacterium]